MELLRAEALTRDEYRLRVALEHHAANRFDIESVRTAWQRIAELVETLAFIARDDSLWNTLNDGAGVLGTDDLRTLSSFADEEFGALLIVCGYRCPPPPPVDELIADTRQALGLALEAGPSRELIADARSNLITFVYRVRRQMRESETEAPAPMDVLGRKVLKVGRQLIPVVVGVAAGAAVGQLLGPVAGLGVGTGVASAAGKAATASLEALAKRGVEWAASAAMGSASLDPPATGSEELGQLPIPSEAVAAHLAIARSGLRAVESSDITSVGAARQIQEIERHLARVCELCGDHDESYDVASAVRLARRALSVLAERAGDRSQSWYYEEPTDNALFKFARDAIEIASTTTFEGHCFGVPLAEEVVVGWRVARSNLQQMQLYVEWRNATSALSHAPLQAEGSGAVGAVQYEQQEPVLRTREMGSS